MAAWNDARAAAAVGGEDFRAMAEALLDLARQLDGNFTVSAAPKGLPSAPLSARTLNAMFSAATQRAEQRVLDRAGQAGRRWSSFERFVEAAKTESDRRDRRNFAKLLAWRTLKGPLLEALCLLAILNRHSSVERQQPVWLFRRSKTPVSVRDEQRQPSFIWLNPSLPATVSGLRAKPDLLCTTAPSLPPPTSIRWLVECKCRESLTSADIRQEFGKAFDLGTPTYTIVSYYQPDDRIADAAQQLGLDIEPFGLGTTRRSAFVAEPGTLGTQLSRRLADAREAQRFAHRIAEKAETLRLPGTRARAI
jgi:hypothetical protein